MSARRQWELATGFGPRQAEALVREGWEPYAVTDSNGTYLYHLKRDIQQKAEPTEDTVWNAVPVVSSVESMALSLNGRIIITMPNGFNQCSLTVEFAKLMHDQIAKAIDEASTSRPEGAQ